MTIMKSIKILSAFLLIIISACNNPKIANEKTTGVNPVDSISNTAKPLSQETCYKSNAGNSLVEMTLTEKDGLVQGTLNYLPEAKDKNTGFLKGTMKADTLLADYTFMSEGVESVRQVIFLKTALGFREGYGPVKDLNGKMVFEDTRTIDFSKSAELVKVECKSGKL